MSTNPTPTNNRQRLQAIEGRLDTIEQNLNLAPKPPKPPNRFIRFFIYYWANKAWTLTVTAICIAVFGWFANPLIKTWLDHRNDSFNKSVDDRIQASLNAPKGVLEVLRETQDKTNMTSTALETLKPFIHDVIAHQFENVSKLPTQALLQRAHALNDLAAVAKNESVKIDPKVVAQAGAKLVAASSQKPVLWDATLKFVEYKSFNNSFSPSLPDTTNEQEFRDKYMMYIPEGAHPPSPSLKGKVPADVAAQTGYIGEDRNTGLAFGPAWIVMEGGEVGLDGLELRNVIFHNVQISYFGGPVSMKNVYFIGCTFKMQNTPITQRLVLALFEPEPSTTFPKSPRS
jgi:hypothetical protein